MESVYPAGMLDRDQRTAKIRLCQCRCSDMEVPNRTNSFTTDASTKISSIFSSIVFNKKRTKFSYLIWKKGYLIHTYNFPRVKNVVLVLVYLTLTMMNPASTAPAHDEVQEDKWWEKPCGSVEPSDPLPTSPPEIFFKWHLSDLLVQAEYNLIQANHLKDSFAFYTIGNAFDYRDNPQWSYPWLENRARTKYLKGDQESEEIMKELYRSYQILAVAFQHLIDEGGIRAQVFENEKWQLKLLLCEMKEALRERKLEPYPVSESDMPDEYKNMKDESQRSRRDFIIFNSYLSIMEWTIDYIKTNGFNVENQKN
ncbi:uncharacterized protein [Diabrotica undecimpunctata]|uniref:uncharacterized protein isoform X4 n=1 Tax=Diabrotica undecimpunctata TaxID=50387 RepID=UPI003B63D228